jgi:cytochrome c oxidase subunit III
MASSIQDDPHKPSDGHHARFLAHHFESSQQQFAAGKLGMWIFLVTEVLLFGGLFCAYTVYRSNHPEVFQYAAEEFLDKKLGAINTCVLIFSSFTMAWAVRSAQLNQQRRLMILLAITLVCGLGFLGIKYVEYKHKWEEGLLWARSYHPLTEEAGGKAKADAATQASAATAAPTTQQLLDNPPPMQSQLAIVAPRKDDDEAKHQFKTEPKNVGVFFSIYFMMTGLHGLHVIGGMGAIAWALRRAAKGHFSSSYFGPVDFVGLYWHLVDLVWIYLFPLLYLIH